MNLNKTSIGALTLSSLLMMNGAPAYAVTTITIVTESSLANVVDLLRWDFENNFCTDPANPSGEPTCDVSVIINSDLTATRDEIVNSGSSGVNYDLFLAPDPVPSDLYYKYQFSHPNVVVGKPFIFATDSVVLYSAFPGVGVDVSAGFPNHLADGVKFAIGDPVTDAYGVVSAQILAGSPNLKSALSHVETVNNGFTAYAATSYYDPTQPFGYPFGFVPKSAACFDLKLPAYYSVYDFSQQEKLKAINTVSLAGVTIVKKRNKEETVLLNSFVSYITGKNNGNSSSHTAADELQTNCYVPVTSKLENKDHSHGDH